MPTKSMLVTLPSFDDTTAYLSVWARKTFEAAKNKSVKILALEGEETIRKNLEVRLQSQTPCFVFFNGHGSRDHIYGHDNEIILDKTNVALLKSAVVYSRSCDSAAVLGVNYTF